MGNRMCSYCGGTNLVEEHDVLKLTEPFGGIATVEVIKIKCNECGFIEEDDRNDRVIQKELAILKRNSMIHILKDLNEKGYTNAYMERALGLPARTLARWKNESSMSPSASGSALMRFIRTFPWLLHVADCQFDQEKARTIFLTNAMTESININEQIKNWSVTSGAFTSENYYLFAIGYSRDIPVETISGCQQVFDNINTGCICASQ